MTAKPITWTTKDRDFREGNFDAGSQRFVFEMTRESTRYGRRTVRMWWWSIRPDGGHEMANGHFADRPVATANEIAARFARKFHGLVTISIEPEPAEHADEETFAVTDDHGDDDESGLSRVDAEASAQERRDYYEGRGHTVQVRA